MHPQRVAGKDFGTVASLGHFSAKMSKVSSLRSMASVTVPFSKNFCLQKLKRMTWTTFGFNRAGLFATQPTNLLRTIFENRKISRNSDVNWPPRSCDLTPLDCFLWGAVKDKCYANHLETIEALKHEIEVAIHGIEAQTIENVLKNWVDRMEYSNASRGSHLNDVVFGS